MRQSKKANGCLSPPELLRIKEFAKRAIGKIKPADDTTKFSENLVRNPGRTRAGQELPKYYLVYFLFVDLLGFAHLGRGEKVAWSIPIDFDGVAFLIEHRRFGLGIFSGDPENAEPQAAEIVKLIRKGVRVAEPFFKSIAATSIAGSKLNVHNRSRWLFDRYKFHRSAFRRAKAKASVDVGKLDLKKHGRGVSTSYRVPGRTLSEQSTWQAIAAIDAFFSWTEHVFIHLAILQRKATTGENVAQLANAEWSEKFVAACGLDDPIVKKAYDELSEIKRQIRNFIAHGSFGKNGEAFYFHSKIGAVPVLLDSGSKNSRYSISGVREFDNETAIAQLDAFIKLLWSGPRRPARIYIHDHGFESILTFCQDGTYEEAMRSTNSMEDLVGMLSHYFDQAANMDF